MVFTIFGTMSGPKPRALGDLGGSWAFGDPKKPGQCSCVPFLFPWVVHVGLLLLVLRSLSAPLEPFCCFVSDHPLQLRSFNEKPQ